LVGYTNAGKSSLFNALTRGGAYAADKLFATLGTRVESWNLAGGNAAMLSDTVGFVQRLPHHLVASFRATLEDAIASHVILIVLDVADPSALMQYETVQSVLDRLARINSRAYCFSTRPIDCRRPELASTHESLSGWSAFLGRCPFLRLPVLDSRNFRSGCLD
jgi:GTP-binding protein HflX